MNQCLSGKTSVSKFFVFEGNVGRIEYCKKTISGDLLGRVSNARNMVKLTFVAGVEPLSLYLSTAIPEKE